MSQKASQAGLFWRVLDGVLAWLPAVDLIGQIPVLELDLEETSDAAKQQWKHRDPGAD